MRIVVFCAFVLCYSTLAAQELLTWGHLAEVKFSEEYSKDYGMDLTKGDFSDHLLSFDGKEVIIKGYVIPIDPMGTAYVISRNPNASCFFCGGAGPETVVGLRLKPEAVKRYKTDAHLSFKGTFKLNEMNSRQFHYMLLDAEEH